ncbi:MAG: hypothetical protein IKT00_12870 [Prevotella sp.]|nr:hypothetical protein [Prevotella sp.]
MAVNKETKRTINLYINNKEIDGSVRSIRSQINKLTKEMNKLKIGTEEYEEKAAKIADLNAILKTHRDYINHVNTGYKGLNDHIKDVVKNGIGGLIGRMAYGLWGTITNGINEAISAYNGLDSGSIRTRGPGTLPFPFGERHRAHPHTTGRAGLLCLSLHRISGGQSFHRRCPGEPLTLVFAVS